MEIVTILRTNWAKKRLSASQQNDYKIFKQCYICSHKFVVCEEKNFNIRYHNNITGWLIGVVYRQFNLERHVSLKIFVFSQLSWLQCAPDCLQVWKATWPRDQSDQPKHEKISPGRVEAIT